MLTDSEVLALMEGGCNRAEIMAACRCDETVAKAKMVKAVMSGGIDQRNPRRIMHLGQQAGQLAGNSADSRVG
jgi:hypothetical protein